MRFSHGKVRVRGWAVILAGIVGLSLSGFGAEEKGDKADQAKEDKQKIKPYDEVITKEAVTRSGLFRVHQVEDKLFFELLPAALDRELLWVTQIAETTAGNSYSGMPVDNQVVRWEKRGERSPAPAGELRHSGGNGRSDCVGGAEIEPGADHQGV